MPILLPILLPEVNKNSTEEGYPMKASRLRAQRKGFTLMEIMVVIIVIAVLASVAGPMIGTITDQGRASATRAQMSNIKSALVALKSDTGHYPHSNASAAGCSTTYSGADNTMMNSDSANVLYNGNFAQNQWGIAPATWDARYKGPYMDSDPSDFMNDAWSTKIQYEMDSSKHLWLHSAGADGAFDTNCANISKDAYTGDDLVLSIAIVK